MTAKRKYSEIIILFSVAAVTAGAALIAGCSEDSATGPPGPVKIEFTDVDHPDTVWTGTAYPATIRASISGVNELQETPITVTGTIGKDGFTHTLTFADDGVPPDNIGGDFEFTGTFPSDTLAAVSGNATLTLSIREAQYKTSESPLPPYTIGEPYSAAITVVPEERNMPPVISSLQGLAPEIFYDASDSTLLTVSVTDPQGESDISSVTGYVYFPHQAVPKDTVLFSDQGVQGIVTAANGDGTIYLGSMMHDKIEIFGSGLYRIRVIARDRAGNESNEIVQSFMALQGLVDHPPEIVQIIAPDSVKLDTQNGNLVPLQVEVADSNGLGDIREVWYTFSASASGNPVYMFDGGGENPISGDAVEGDGIYSIVVVFPPNSPPGSYSFTFHVMDRQLNLVSKEHPFVLY